MEKYHKSLLKWYDQEGRTLPWRTKGKQDPNPYHVWLSEIMLQQTTVTTVIPYFLSFIQRWPTLSALADAHMDDILHAWQGLGYYARARNLHRCAKILVNENIGQFPKHSHALLKLPGIGTYTAKAIAAIAFKENVLPVDGNITRILSRLYAISTPLPEGRYEIQEAAYSFAPQQRPGDLAQAMMDLGTSICTPKTPLCQLCPIQSACKAFALNLTADLPIKSQKRFRPQKYAVAYILEREDKAILLRRRPEKGLLGGMMEVPTSAWKLEKLDNACIEEDAPYSAQWKSLSTSISHSFTHFDLEVTLYYGAIDTSVSKNTKDIWALPDELQNYALPKLFKKIIDASLKSYQAPLT